MAEPSWDVLSTKVEFQGQQIKELAEDTAKQFVEFREDTGRQLSSLRGDVKGEFVGLRGSLENLANTLASNNSEREKSSRGSWISLLGTGLTAIGISAGILGTLATLRLTPIENDVKNLKEGQTAALALVERITTKLDNFETRAELQQHDKIVEASIGANKASIDKLEDTKVSHTELDGITRERNAQVARLVQDISDQKVINTAQANTIIDLRVSLASIGTTLGERRRELDRVQSDLDRRATTEALDGLRLRLTDQRDRTNILSSRVQDLSLKVGATPSTEKSEAPAGAK